MGRAIFLFLFLVAGFCLHAQKTVSGFVMQEDEKGTLTPISFANVYWQETTQGTVTDSTGFFELEDDHQNHLLVISYVGYKNDTLHIEKHLGLVIVLKPSLQLTQVEIEKRRKSTTISYMSTLKVENISEKELFKAACCNLSESFETNPSVDVSFTDAITGSKQIKLLGLDGKYTQITIENMPGIRGLATYKGLGFIPGAWIESMQLSKGTGSVVNGHESIAGQINVELKKAEFKKDQLFVNGYVNQAARSEINTYYNESLSDNLATAVLFHASTRPWETDQNKDGFRDNSLGTQVNLMNRWKYMGLNGLQAQLGFQVLQDENEGGQLSSKPDSVRWQSDVSTVRGEAWGKLGYVFPNKKYKSFGVQIKAVYHDQKAEYGMKSHNAVETMFYANLIYQSIINNTNHTFRTGLSFAYDEIIEEIYPNHSVRLFNYLEGVRNIPNEITNRYENVGGAFFEYSFNPSERFSLVAGLRGDYNAFYDFCTFTPRLHLRRAFESNAVLRFSAGSGWRSANVFVENPVFFTSNRRWAFEHFYLSRFDRYTPLEKAWNFGLNFYKPFRLNYRDGAWSIDLYKTVFSRKIVVFPIYNTVAYNIPIETERMGDYSYSNSFQFQLDYELIRKMDVSVAYRFLEVKTRYTPKGVERRFGFFQPLLAKHRVFVNAGYENRNDWKFDATVNWQGEKLVPNEESPKSNPFITVNAQVSKKWREKVEWYVGVENLLNYRQPNPIRSAENPSDDLFDAAMIWGPLFGRNIYFGFRWWMK